MNNNQVANNNPLNNLTNQSNSVMNNNTQTNG